MLLTCSNIFYHVVAAISPIIPVILIKKYNIQKGNKKNSWLLVLSLLSYIALIYAYTKIIPKTSRISTEYASLKVISIIVAILIAIIIFHEHVTTYMLIGIVLAMISLHMLSSI